MGVESNAPTFSMFCSNYSIGSPCLRFATLAHFFPLFHFLLIFAFPKSYLVPANADALPTELPLDKIDYTDFSLSVKGFCGGSVRT